MVHFFTKSRTEFWLAQMLTQRMVEEMGKDPLTPLLRQEIATFVSHLNHCTYCSASHSADVEVLGGDVDAVAQAAGDLGTAPFDDRKRALFAFVKKIVKSPETFGKDDWHEAMDAGWRNDELESAIYVAAWYQFMNTIATGNLIPATDKETALALARSRQKPEMYDELVTKLEKLTKRKVVLMIEDSREN